MNDLIFILVPILIADIVNPVLFAGTVYGMGSRHPVINTWIILLSFFFSYFVAGIAIAIGMEALTDFFHIPLTFDYVIEFIIAVCLIVVAWKTYRSGDPHLEEQIVVPPHMSAWGAILMGLSINVIGLPLAIPYLAAIDQILIANLDVFPSVVVLLLYNIAYILPFSLMILVRKIYKEESDVIFKKINRWFHWMAGKGIPILFFILGLLLLEDCVSYLLNYREYSWISLMKRQ